MDKFSEFEPVHAAGHIDVGKEQAHIVVLLQHCDSLIGATGVDDAESGVLENIASVHTDERIVFDDEYEGAITEHLLPIVPSLNTPGLYQ
jgi:hypothetical protein